MQKNFLIPTGWLQKELDEILCLSKEKYDSQKSDENFPCIEMEHLQKESSKLLGTIDSKEQKSVKNKFNKNEILFGKLRPYLRKFLYTSFEGVCSSEIWVFKNTKLSISKFIYYFIQAPRFYYYACKSTGSRMPRSDWSLLKNISFSIPSLPKQNRIVTVLETWDQAIEKLARKIDIKKRIKKGLMQKLLTGKIRLPGFSDEWEITKLGNIANIYDGTHQTPKYTEAGIPFYSVEHITSNNFSDTKFISTDVYEKEIKKVKIEKGDILMTRIGDIGTAKFIDWEVKASFYVTLALIKCIKKINTKFLVFAINSEKFQKEIWGKTIHVAFPNKINLGDINKCKISIPKSLEEQTAIARILTTADQEIEALEKKRNLIEQQKRFLLNNLITGKIRIPE